MKIKPTKAEGVRRLAAKPTRTAVVETKTLWFNLSNKDEMPVLKVHPYNRNLQPIDKAKRRVLKASIRKRGAIEAVTVTKDGLILSGHNRLAIARELWDEGVDVSVGITVNPFVDVEESELRNILVELQVNSPWSPEDYLISAVKEGSDYAKFILKMANEPVDFLLSKKFGIRNACVTFGINPNQLGKLPMSCSQGDYTAANRIFNEIRTLLTLGKQGSDRGNNWTEAFIKAWRRIRLNDPSLKSVDENGDCTVINTKALNSKINELGIERLGKEWRSHADKLYSTARIGRWANMLETVIMETWKYENLRKQL